jgi:hypothetical protein
MSRLMSFFSSDDPVPEAIESHPLNELPPTTAHTYPPASGTLASVDHDDCRPSAIIHTYPPQPVISSNKECPMELDNPWQSVRRVRDDDEQRVRNVQFGSLCQLTNNEYLAE